jgi:hypothetical protein
VLRKEWCWRGGRRAGGGGDGGEQGDGGRLPRRGRDDPARRRRRRHGAFLPHALLRSAPRPPALPPLRSSPRLDSRGGWGPVDLRGCGAVRRRVDWVGSVSDWLVVRSLREMPRFCSVPVGDFAAAYWSSEESIGCSLRLAASTRWRRLEMRRGLS